MTKRRQNSTAQNWHKAAQRLTHHAIAFVPARRLIQRRFKSRERNQLYLLLRAAAALHERRSDGSGCRAIRALLPAFCRCDSAGGPQRAPASSSAFLYPLQQFMRCEAPWADAAREPTDDNFLPIVSSAFNRRINCRRTLMRICPCVDDRAVRSTEVSHEQTNNTRRDFAA